MITLDINFDGPLAAIDKVAAAIRAGPITGPLHIAMVSTIQLYAAETMERFDVLSGHGAWQGMSWQQHSESTIEKRARNLSRSQWGGSLKRHGITYTHVLPEGDPFPLLYETSGTLESFNIGANRNIMTFDATGATYGSNADWVAVHHYGSTNGREPARPVMAMPSNNVIEAMTAFHRTALDQILST